MTLALIRGCFPSVTWYAKTTEEWEDAQTKARVQVGNQVQQINCSLKEYGYEEILGNTWKINDTLFQKHIKTETTTTMLTIGSWAITLWTSKNTTSVLVEIQGKPAKHEYEVKVEGIIDSITSIYRAQSLSNKMTLVLEAKESGKNTSIPFTNNQQVDQQAATYWTYMGV